ncbi:MAG: hypothetical protein JST24_09970 [Acidobacteria bacterium]|nr:hypothetical protein [Acidobacteriota bacterium]
MPFLPPFQTPAVVRLDAGTRYVPPKGSESFANPPEGAPPEVWADGRLFLLGNYAIQELGRVQPPLAFGKGPNELAWYLDYDLVEGAAFAWAFGDDRAPGQKGRDIKEVRSTLYIYRNGGDRWELWDTIQTTKDAWINWLRPLEGGGYLLGGRFNDAEMHRADPLAIATRNGHGKLIIHETEDVDLGAPAFVWRTPEPLPAGEGPQLPDANRPRWMRNPALIGPLSALSQFGWQFRVPGHLVLVARHLGIFFVINSRTGRLERSARIFDLPKDADAEPLAYETGVLGVQPRPDGHLLIAARSADAMQQSRTWKPDLPPPEPVRLSASEAFGKTAEEQGEAMEMKQDQAKNDYEAQAREARLKAFPDLVWWDFNPDTGTFRQEPPPAGVPDKFPSCAALRAFTFAFKPDGNLEIEPKVWK